MLSSTVLFLGGSCCYIKKRPQRIECKSSCCKRKEVRTSFCSWIWQRCKPCSLIPPLYSPWTQRTSRSWLARRQRQFHSSLFIWGGESWSLSWGCLPRWWYSGPFSTSKTPHGCNKGMRWIATLVVSIYPQVNTHTSQSYTMSCTFWKHYTQLVYAKKHKTC